MPTFTFEAMNNQGQAIKDEIEANSTEDAIAKIRAQGFFPTNVKEKGGRRKAAKGGPGKKKAGFTIGGVSNAQLTQFTRQLSTLQDAGLPIVRSLKILEGQLKPGALKNILGVVAEDVEGGSTFSEALAKHPKAFDKLYVNMIKAGEAGGVLDTILERLADFREKAQRLKKRIMGAMIYPAAVVTIAGTILTGIMIFIIPKFETMFKEMNVELPGITQGLIAFSSFLQNQWYMLPLFPAAAFAIFKIIGMNKMGRYGMDWAKLRLPVFGTIINKSMISRFCRTLATLIASGVPILEALNIVRETTGNSVLTSAITRIHDSVREGESIAAPLKQSKVCDDMVVNMVDVGEETGELDKMLTKISDNYDEEVDTLVEGMVSLIEPIMIIFMGLAVGGIVIALFLPLIKLMGSIGSG
ncbi:MAG: type II secretion system F family protein [Planctomycetes bacterium]|nr:type II secretion system F family protein [Planctomycetota bacterium]